jgi:hypothetical protein
MKKPSNADDPRVQESPEFIVAPMTNVKIAVKAPTPTLTMERTVSTIRSVMILVQPRLRKSVITLLPASIKFIP